ncbi:MAG: ABC transporter substrate-binding protein [Pseudomonadota bacterium]
MCKTHIRSSLVLFALLQLSAATAQQNYHKVVSLDYCADQFVLKLVEPARIAALSKDADREFSYMRDRAAGHKKIRPSAEEVLAVDPDWIVRSYGGGPNARRFYEGIGLTVIQIGYATTIDDVRGEVERVGGLLGRTDEAESVVRDMDQRLARLTRQAQDVAPSILYVTPGGVTTGPGTLVHELIVAAGLNNFQQSSGWRSLPLEKLAFDQPELLATAFYNYKTNHENFWSAARHPIIRKQLSATRTIALEGATTACGGWFLVDAVEQLAQGVTRP